MKAILLAVCWILYFSPALFADSRLIHAKRVCEQYPPDSCHCEVDDNVIKVMKEIAKAEGAKNITFTLYTSYYYETKQGDSWERADFVFTDRNGKIKFNFIPLRTSDCEVGGYATGGDQSKTISID